MVLHRDRIVLGLRVAAFRALEIERIIADQLDLQLTSRLAFLPGVFLRGRVHAQWIFPRESRGRDRAAERQLLERWPCPVQTQAEYSGMTRTHSCGIPSIRTAT